MVYFNLNCSKRYYDFIPLKIDDNTFKVDDIYKISNVVPLDKFNIVWECEEFKITQRVIHSETPYFVGNSLANEISLEKDGTPPFVYDLFCIEIKSLSIILIGLPFLRLAKIIAEDIEDEVDVIKKISFIRPDLKRFSALCEEQSTFENKFQCEVKGIYLDMIDKDTSQLKLLGNNPLASGLYKNVLKDYIESNKSHFNKFTFSTGTDILTIRDVPKTENAIIHMDKFGNCKSYIRINGENLYTVPLLYLTLGKHNCLEAVSSNPLKKIRESSDELN